MPRLRRTLCCGLLLLGSAPALVQAGKVCPQERFEVTGTVLTPSGQAAARARVYVLLDRMSKKKFRQHGIRARSTSVDGKGRFHVAIDCAAQRARPDESNPCARRVKEVTVGIETSGGQLTFRTFELGSLEIRTFGDSCLLRVPRIRLAADLTTR